MRGFLFLFIFLSLLPKLLWAFGFEDAVFPELATSSRALAMGNAFICKVDDSSAVFYNPAGLGTVRYPHLHLSNFHLEVNKGWMGMGTGGNVFDIGGNFIKGFSLDGTRELLLENKGKIGHSRFHMLPNFTTRYFSFGYLLSRQMRATLGQDTGDQLEYATRFDHGPYMGVNLSLFGGIFKVGASVIYLYRSEAIGEADPNTAIDLKSSDYDRGKAFIFTGGARLTFPWELLPTFALTAHNVTDQRFTNRGSGAPSQIKQTFDAGFSITPQVGKTVRIHLEFNYKDVLQEYSDVPFTRRFLMGMELDISRTFFFRLGYGDGFGSGGMGIRTRKLEFDLTTYAVDTTTSVFRGKEDRRYVLGISSGF